MRVLILVTATMASAVALPNSAVLSGSPTVCPSFLMNCDCTTMSAGVIVSCRSLIDRNQLRATIRDLRGFNLQQFTMTNSNIAIENGDFAEVTLYNMDVDSSSFTVRSINDGFLVDSSNNLKVLKFQNSRVTFSGTTLKHTQLSTLWFNNTLFIDYDQGWFEGLSVVWLRITSSPSLNMGVASNMRSLQKYSHTASNLTELERSMLPENSASIRELDFSGNNIVSVGDTFLDGLDNLMKLDLSNNKLETLSERTFGKFPAEGNLYISNNPLKCNSGLKWLAERLAKGTFKQPHRYTCINEFGRSQSIRDLAKSASTYQEDVEETT